MKKYAIFISLFCCFAAVVQAQTPKFGHINVQELVDLMPERDSAVVSYQKYFAQTEETFVGMQNELQMKYAEYQQKNATWTAAILETKQREIQEINSRLEAFRENASQDLEQMQTILFAPVYNKANDAIKKVAKDLGLIYVFNSTGMPYIDDTQSIHLLDKAKSELKIPAEKVAPTQVGGQTQR
ncbi:MAG: OmpH family outer membrane protein [Prevotellaceae bacterium]|jgi:outer membrane protein|nr:OmpH family outer membrane protein [Prevotellaceae bacterium]